MLRWTLMQREHWWNQYGMLLNVFYYTLRNPHYKDSEEAIHKLKGTCWRMQDFWCPMFICCCNIYPYDGDIDELFSCPRGTVHCSLHVQWSLHYCWSSQHALSRVLLFLGLLVYFLSLMNYLLDWHFLIYVWKKVFLLFFSFLWIKLLCFFSCCQYLLDQWFFPIFCKSRCFFPSLISWVILSFLKWQGDFM